MNAEEFERWQERSTKVWNAYEMGVRDKRILRDLLDPDDDARVALVAQLFKRAAGGFDPQVSCMFGKVAIAGLADDVKVDDDPVEVGWMFMQIAADAGWEPAQEILEKHPDRK